MAEHDRAVSVTIVPYRTTGARLRAAARVVTAQAGIAYMALWAVAWWAIGSGGTMLSRAGCRLTAAVPDVLAWSCTDVGALQTLAGLVNGVLASTLMMPVAVAAAVMEPGFRVATLAVLALHLVGFPAAILVAVRMCERLFDRVARRPSGLDTIAGVDTRTPEPLCFVPADRVPLAEPARRIVPPRETFGLRGGRDELDAFTGPPPLVG